MINVDSADAYFSTRTMGRAWGEFSADQRKSSIEQAKRDLARALGRAMREDEPQFRYGDQARDEYAVYEQALFSLLRDAQPNGIGSDIPSLEPDEKSPNSHTLSSGSRKWSEEALSWLGASGRVHIVLG